MNVLYNGEKVAEITTNMSMTRQEMIESCYEIDVNDQDDLHRLYDEGVPFVCLEETFFIDWDGIELD